jgi:hypothetical protein
MKRTMIDPWRFGQNVESDRCWHCLQEFTKDDAVKVVDSVDLKLVHDREPCANAMFLAEIPED